MASLHEAWPTTSTSTGTPAAVRAVPHRVAGTLLAAGPGLPPAAVVLCFPGVAPQPATTPAASSTKALARSEERRVGKEGRARWAADHYGKTRRERLE